MGGFNSVSLRLSTIFLLVKIGCNSWSIFLPRSRSCLRTTSADFWSLSGIMILMGLPAGEWIRSGGWWTRLIAEPISFSGYFNFKNIPFKFLHSRVRNSGVDDKRFPRSSIVLRSDRLYLLSTWLWKCRTSPLFVVFLQTRVSRRWAALIISIPMNGKQLLIAASMVNWIEGWTSFRVVSKSMTLEWSRARASVSSTYLF